MKTERLGVGSFWGRNADSGTRGVLPENQVHRWTGAHACNSSREEAEAGDQKFMVSLGHIVRLSQQEKHEFKPVVTVDIQLSKCSCHLI